MKRTLALVGLLVVGLLLLLDPDTGIVTATAQQTAQTSGVVASSTTTGAPPRPEASSTTTTTEPPESSTTSSTTTSSTTTTTTTDGTFSIIGEAVPSPFGFFQVEVVFEDGVMTDIITLEEPPDRRSQRINDSAIPVYEEEAISAQSSDFDVISGATVTWEAWGASLESALYEAGV